MEQDARAYQSGPERGLQGAVNASQAQKGVLKRKQSVVKGPSRGPSVPRRVEIFS
jgi:hypothetical protein